MGQTLICVDCATVNWRSAETCARCGSAELLTRVSGSDVLFKDYYEPERTFSQNVARFFEIVDYLLLVPAAFGLLLSLMLVTAAPWFTLIVACWTTAGCFLLGGFYKHSRNQPLERGTTFLWSATISYNLVEAIAIFLFSKYNAPHLAAFAIWPLVVIALSIAALRSEEEAKQKAFAPKPVNHQTAA